MPSYPFKLICTNPFHGYERGQQILDPDEIAEHLEDREHHFVKVMMDEHDVAKLKEMQAAAKAEAEAAIQRATDEAAADEPHHRRKSK
jgi:hypothetical protein